MVVGPEELEPVPAPAVPSPISAPALQAAAEPEPEPLRLASVPRPSRQTAKSAPHKATEAMAATAEAEEAPMPMAMEAVVVPLAMAPSPPTINVGGRAGLKMEIQECHPVNCDNPCGFCGWEACIVEADYGPTCDVRIEEDGCLCKDVACRYLRMPGGRGTRKRKV